MKTYDVYRLIADEGKTRFRRQKDGAIYVWNGDSLLPEERRGWSPFISLTEDWVEVEQPVSFPTAFAALRKHNKNIFCVFEGGKHFYYHDYPGAHCFNEDHIANGEWYIEDGEV